MTPSRRMPRRARAILAGALAAMLAGCGTTSRDGPPARPPSGLERTPDAVPRVESIRSGGPNKPYVINGRRYTPETRDLPLAERGLASWYGTKFHGLPTANGETYDMYAMTAAHPTMPLPSYARVRNPANGREIIVRVNDRGPFHPGRVIDLSYAAALRLGLLRGVAPVELERLTNDAIRTASWRGAPMAGFAPGGGDAAEQAAARRDDELAARRAAAARAALATEASAATAPIGAETSSRAGPASGLGVPFEAVAPAQRLPSPQPAAPSTDPVPARAGMADGATAVPPATPSTPGSDDSSMVPAPASASTPSLPAAPATRPVAQAGPGWWIQLGAFGQQAGAQGFGRQVAGAVGWVAPLLTVFDDGSLHRLQAGPYASRDEAGAAADRLREALRLVPVLIERR